MKFQYKFIIFLVLLFSLLSVFWVLSSYNFVQAIGLDDAERLLRKASGGEGAGFDINRSDPAVIVSSAIIGMLSVVGVVFLILMVYGGVRWMTARGESEIVEKSKGIIRNAMTGLVIVFLAYAIVWTVSYFLIY